MARTGEMSLLMMEGETRRLLAQTTATASYFSKEDIRSSLQEGLTDICLIGGVFVIKSSVAGAAAGDLLPANFLSVVSIRRSDNTTYQTLSPIQATDVGRVFVHATPPNTAPMYYYVTEEWTATTNDRRIRYWPVPTGTFISPASGYPLFYKAMDTFTTSLADAEIPKVAAKYHYALVYYAVFRCLLKAKKANEAKFFYSNYAKDAGITVAKPVPVVTQ